ncbi:urokinase-type plasminogen activator-like [Periophthalmus magnuspinnatus]|uniref:urokinase-type plasminogen activator-like n=1 Tax=Periophthalmus magnuspinnatus TaxID=409849 RepID=UPI002436D5A9|nr:urokinase-type plasminogen activator-like [Periophthalmus magnuspinnatus]
MELFVFLMWSLIALIEARPERALSALLSSSYSSSSSIETSVRGECLNGGTSVPTLTTRELLFCLCPDGFKGKRCEIDTRVLCYEGRGMYYRGTVSRSESGLPCQEWDLDTRVRYMASDVNKGRHNYCRNLLLKRRPWCYVRKNQELVWEYCDIPRCGLDTYPDKPAPTMSEPNPGESPSCGVRTKGKMMKIVGGMVSTVEAQPWMAAVFWRSKTKDRVFRCGGSLISPCWLLTAAHCFPDGSQTKPRHFSVVLGKNALNKTDLEMEQNFRVEEIILHEGYDNSEGNFNNDIALVKLKPKGGRCAVESKSVKSVCLPPTNQSLQTGLNCEISGYGKEKHGLWYRSQVLREAEVQVLSDETCRRDDHYGDMITRNMFCAGRPDWSQDACEGDSGGPLVCEVGGRLFLFGIISWGDGCAQENRPGVYTRVSNYNEWIQNKTGLPFVNPGPLFPIK